MVEYLKNRPMLLCGIISCICTAVSLNSDIMLTICCIAVTIILVLALLFNAQAKLILIFILLIPLMCNTIRVRGNIRKAEAAEKIIAACTVCVNEITYESSDFCVASVQVIGGELEKGIKLSVLYSDEQLYVGQAVEAKVVLEAIEREYRENYYSMGIFLKGTMDNIKPVNQMDDLVLISVQKLRNYIKNTLFSHIGYDEAATLCALIFGDNKYFSDEFYLNVKGAGVSHVMVVSGMHLSILVTLFTALAEKLFYNRYFKAICMVLTALLLTALCGFSMSILRAGVTYILMSLALVLNRPSNCQNILGAAVTLILLFSPNAVMSAAFQLSVLSTFGILCVALPITRYIEESGIIKSILLRGAAATVFVTLSALILTLPIAIRLFGYVSNVSILTNILISYAVTLVIWLCVIALILEHLIPLAADSIFILCSAITKYINSVINYFGSLEFSVTVLPESSWILAVMVIILIFWILLACKKRRYMIKLKEIDEMILSEGGVKAKWRRFLKRL